VLRVQAIEKAWTHFWITENQCLTNSALQVGCPPAKAKSDITLYNIIDLCQLVVDVVKPDQPGLPQPGHTQLMSSEI
jgi:hypothetical protein